jgi:hypothetical protein
MHDLNLPVRQHIPPIRPSHAKPRRDRYALNAITTCVSLDPRCHTDETTSVIDGWPRAPLNLTERPGSQLLQGTTPVNAWGTPIGVVAHIRSMFPRDHYTGADHADLMPSNDSPPRSLHRT